MSVRTKKMCPDTLLKHQIQSADPIQAISAVFNDLVCDIAWPTVAYFKHSSVGISCTVSFCCLM